MTKRLSALVLLWSVLPCGAASAQRTWIVDATGGAGVDFTDIQPGVNAAADGDTLLVRAGTYTGFRVVAKGLSILGQTGVQIPGISSVRIESTSAAQPVTLSDLQVTGDGIVFQFSGVYGCQGRVLLERVRFGNFHYGFNADGAADLRLSQCDIQCGSSLRNARVVVTDSTLAYNRMALNPSVALAVVGSDVTLSRCGVAGQSAFNRAQAGSAMSIDAPSVVTVTDDGTHVIGAGAGALNPLPGIVGSGRLARDPRVVVLGSGGGVGVAGPVETVRSIATLQALGALPSGHVDVELAGASGEVWALVVGLPGAPVPLPEFGGSLAVSGFFFVSAGVFAPAPFRLSLPVSAGMPPGTALCWQAIAGDGVAAWQLSNPATYARTR